MCEIVINMTIFEKMIDVEDPTYRTKVVRIGPYDRETILKLYSNLSKEELIKYATKHMCSMFHYDVKVDRLIGPDWGDYRVDWYDGRLTNGWHLIVKVGLI